MKIQYTIKNQKKVKVNKHFLTNSIVGGVFLWKKYMIFMKGIETI